LISYWSTEAFNAEFVFQEAVQFAGKTRQCTASWVCLVWLFRLCTINVSLHQLCNLLLVCNNSSALFGNEDTVLHQHCLSMCLD